MMNHCLTMVLNCQKNQIGEIKNDFEKEFTYFLCVPFQFDYKNSYHYHSKYFDV